MTGREFAEHFQYLEDNCATLDPLKRANRMDAFRRYWEPFRSEIFKRAILWYLQHAPDDNPFFPTLGQIVTAQESSCVPPDAPPGPTRAERERNRKEMAEWQNSPEYQALKTKFGID